MSGLGGLFSDSIVSGAFKPHGSTAEPQADGSVNPAYEDRKKKTNEEEEEEDDVLKKGEDHGDEEEEEEEAISSALLEPTTLPWPGDKDRRPQTDNSDGVWSERGGSKPEERDTGFSAGSQDMSEKQSEAEGGRKSKAKWRESMPEGDRWRDDEVEPRRDGDGSQADDEYDDEEEEEGGGGAGGESHWMSEKAALGFTPHVTIVHPSGRSPPEESRLFIEKEGEPQVEPDGVAQLHPEWTVQEDEEDFPCERGCSVKLLLVLSTVAAALLFPLLVWGGFELLPFEPPLLQSAPLRVVYTLRCSFFAMIPILLGVLVQGVARMRHSEMKPLFQSNLLNREVAVHWHFVNESLALFLFYFLQLAVMASYISQDLLKLVPLLTIMFVFGRLIYWICLSLGSSFRGLGFGFSFFPILVMLGVNLYYICSSVGPESVFDVEQPTTAPPPKQRWWG